MSTTDQRPPEQSGPRSLPEFIHDPGISDSVRDTYTILFDQGSGVPMAVEELAKKLGVCKRTAQYNIRKLQALGVLEVEKERSKGGRGRTNRYLFPTPRWWAQEPVAQGCKGCKKGCQKGCQGCKRVQGPQNSPYIGTEIEIEIEIEEEELSLCSYLSNQRAGNFRQDTPGESPGGSGSPLHPWKPRPRNHPFYEHRDSRRLVERFEWLVGTTHTTKRGEPRKVSIPRRSGWFRSANDLLDDHPVEELESVLAHLFTRWDGFLPFPVVNLHSGEVHARFDRQERKVTRLHQVLEYYPEIVAKMSEGDPPAPVEEEVPISRPKGFYDHGEGFPMEAEVAELTDTFAGTKTRRIPGYQVSDYDLFAYRKTFRTMLDPGGEHKIPLEDIRLVVDALAEPGLELDHARYSAPHHLIDRPGEWEHVLASVKIAVKRREMLVAQRGGRPNPAPRPRSRGWCDEEGYYVGPRPDFDEPVYSGDVSKNRAERYCRSMARRAELQATEEAWSR